METAYLDNAATTRVCEAACEAACSAMRTVYGNPSSLHTMGFEAEKLVTAARKQLAAALFCTPGELIFTSGATESNNLAVFGLAGAYPRAGKKIITTAVEHPSVLGPIEQLEKAGYSVLRLPVGTDGAVSPEAFAAAVDDDTLLVSFMAVNNEIGSVFDAAAICRAVKEKNSRTFLHIDAVQGFGKLPFDLRRIGADTAAFSGHKLYAPKGVGALFLRKGVRLAPRVFGGGQENGLRAGTESVPMIAAFGAAAAELLPKREQVLAHYEALRKELLFQLAAIPEVTVNSPPSAVPYILNLSVKGIRSEIMLHHLERGGVFVSSGSACAKGKGSHVLKAMGLSKERADSALRVSFSPETTPADLSRLTEGLKSGLASLQRVR